LDVVNDAPSPSSAKTTSIAFEEDFTTTEINTEQPEPVSLWSEVEGESTTENIFEEDTSDDYFEDEVMITETATHRPEEETLFGISLPETSTAECDIEDSGASEELNTLRPETFEERLTTTENIYEEAVTDQTTTIPDEEEQTDQPTIIDKEEQSEFPEEQTTASKGITSTEEPTTPTIANEVIELIDEEEKKGNYLSTTEEVPVENPSTMKPLTETFAPLTTDSSAEDPKTKFLDDDVITDRPPIAEEEGSADTDETLINTTEVNVEDFTKEPETSTTRPEEEQSTTIRVDSEELFVSDQTPNINSRTKEIISEESLSDQDSFEVEIQTTTSNLDEDVSTEPSEAIESGDFTIDETTPDPVMEQTIGESTSRTDQPDVIRDDMTTEQASKVIMTHMYVMPERKNSTLEESNNISSEIQVDVQPEMSSVSTSNPLDLLVATESINDNIIFDTSEIFPVKAPEEEVTEGNTNVDAVSKIEDPKSSLEKIGDHDGTSYRTEKSISRVVTEVSV